MCACTRRAFVFGLTAPVAAAAFGGFRAQARTPPHVDADALRTRIEKLSVFGRPVGGNFADGVSRVAYSDADVQGRRYVIDLMRQTGLQPRIDPAGNIFGRRPGSDPSLPAVL